MMNNAIDFSSPLAVCPLLVAISLTQCRWFLLYGKRRQDILSPAHQTVNVTILEMLFLLSV
jgi:hypothetical protein